MSDSPLFSLALQAEQRDGLLAPLLRAYLTREHLTAQELATRLGCPLSVLPRLWLCEQPRAAQFEADVERIAASLGLGVEPLARLIADTMRT